MPSAFSHAVAAVALGRAYTRRTLPPRFWILSAACAIAPDIDVLSNRFGFDHTTMIGHRGFTHSLFFAVVLSGLVTLLAFRKPVTGAGRLSLFSCFLAAAVSHSVLDAMVDGTLGVAFLAPFSSARFFLPWRPIVSSPIGWAFFSQAGATTFMNEFVWVWVPSLVVILAPWIRSLFLAKPGHSRGHVVLDTSPGENPTSS
ncbi:MAG TPA: metal-dependent hydrolase [Blastocatellia bacterium]|jgi:inner membrane protein|nr:metal-dependent hydrolase [Blastocatellia bacterium]